jgi:uncharacterized membrane protein YdjX (TVP38/TMEM64 family)
LNKEKKKYRTYAILNIIGLALASVLIAKNYFDKDIIYHLVNEDLGFVYTFFQSKSLLSQYMYVMVFVLIEVIIGLIPAVVMYPIVGYLIGPVPGIFIIFVGNIIGNTVNYLQGKVFVKGFSDNEKSLRMLRKLQDGGAWSLFLLRLNPLTSFDAISYFAGALGMRFDKFFIATFAGLTPLIVVGTIVGQEALEKYQVGFQVIVVLTLAHLVYSIYRSIRRRKIKLLRSRRSK